MRFWPFGLFSSSAAPARPGGVERTIRARYDAAQTTPDNRNHWANADLLSAEIAALPATRQILRSRCRYEVENNSIARGIIETLANDCVGTGVRLQLSGATGTTASGRIKSSNAFDLEKEFNAWADEIHLAAKLRLMRKSKVQDGEAFALFVTNPKLTSRIKLNMKLIEADQVDAGLFLNVKLGAGVWSGIEFDEYGNPAMYYILKQHPGSLGMLGFDKVMYDKVPARFVIHWFRKDRPGQIRGIPEIVSALPLFAQLRRYTLAVLDSAESAANMSAFLTTDNPPDGAADVAPMVEFDLPRNTMTSVPEGWKPYQVKPEQPTTTYVMFKHEIVNEIARCVNMPYNIAACNSSSYNYASGRMDHQTYYKSITVERSSIEEEVLNPILRSFCQEASLAMEEEIEFPQVRQWMFDGTEHVDPEKEATAQSMQLQNLMTSYGREYAKKGLDWQEEFQQIASEKAVMKQLGLEPADLVKKTKTEPPIDEQNPNKQAA
jgi:lambda family phage portal protein